MPSALVHIGTHKTGSSAFQLWVDRHRESLVAADVDPYEGRYGTNHYELGLLCMRPDRTAFRKRTHPECCLPEWKAETRAHVADQVAASRNRLLVSAESLSLLRHHDEVEALAAALHPCDLRIAVCLREPDSFLRSYRAELAARREPPSPYPSSHAYVEPDTWLVRWDEMLAVWRDVLGADAVHSFAYEPALAADGTTVPGVLDALGIDRAGLGGWEGLRAHVTQPATTRGWRTAVRVRARRLEHLPLARRARSAWLRTRPTPRTASPG